MSRQLAVGYCAAYRGILPEAHLASIQPDRWAPLLGKTMDEGGTCIVAEGAGRIVGSAAFGAPPAEGLDGYAMLYAIYLLPECVGQGIGHRVFETVEREMLRQGYTGCVLEALRGNVRAIRFYERHGYAHDDEFLVEEDGIVMPCVAMSKRFGAVDGGTAAT